MSGESTVPGHAANIQGDDWEGQHGEVHLVRHGQLWTKSNKTGSGSAEHQAKGARLEVRRQFFSQRVVENWNEIPEKVKSAGSVIGFKGRLKKHLQGRMDPVQ
jgi:hypothetical protein